MTHQVRATEQEILSYLGRDLRVLASDANGLGLIPCFITQEKNRRDSHIFVWVWREQRGTDPEPLISRS
jgi:hypothetical protein